MVKNKTVYRALSAFAGASKAASRFSNAPSASFAISLFVPLSAESTQPPAVTALDVPPSPLYDPVLAALFAAI